VVQVEEETKEQIDKWEAETGRCFLVEGVPFSDYVERQWSTFHEQKKQEKQDRVCD
jgi:hypothetical protein